MSYAELCLEHFNRKSFHFDPSRRTRGRLDVMSVADPDTSGGNDNWKAASPLLEATSCHAGFAEGCKFGEGTADSTWISFLL